MPNVTEKLREEHQGERKETFSKRRKLLRGK